jgi:hypothetical protein
MLARQTRPCPVAELVGVDRRVLRQVLCQLQIGAAADACILTAVRDDRSSEIRARILVRIPGPGVFRKDLVGLCSEPLAAPFGVVGFLPPNAVLLECPAFIAVRADHDRHTREGSVWPFRVHVDPSQDGAEVANVVADRMRREMYRNIGLEALLSPRHPG